LQMISAGAIERKEFRKQWEEALAEQNSASALMERESACGLWWWVEEPAFQRMALVFGSYGDEGIENTFQRRRRSRPDPRK
jgi:hypothetical protein